MSSILVFLLASLFINDSEKEQYIEKWQELATIESNRTGIPAAIILGQAILESNYGNSELALGAKNHFGIKCKKIWEGKTFFKKDDDRNEKGMLIESCFRAYSLDMDSFIDHSHFLLDSPCYGSLLEYGKKDYQNWARGLKECGYATDSKYADKLINYIELHQLWALDK